MQGAGNDFVVLDNRRLRLSKDALISLASQICDRKFGVGGDGMLVLLPAEQHNVDYTMFYRNADGSDAGMCGNGARCLALFAHDRGCANNHTFSVHSKRYEASIESSNTVAISFPVETSIEKMELANRTGYFLNTGTEHLVIPVEDHLLKEERRLRHEGRELRHHAKFQPKGANVNFIAGIDEYNVQLQTYERGVEDLTLACGTGAIAAALVWHHLQGADSSEYKYNIETKGGSLFVYFSFNPNTHSYSNIKLKGPAHFVFEGAYFI